MLHDNWTPFKRKGTKRHLYGFEKMGPKVFCAFKIPLLS